MNDKLYNILSKIQRWLPALGVFYLAIANIWSLPFGQQINETIMALAALLATTLEISTVVYLKGEKKNE